MKKLLVIALSFLLLLLCACGPAAEGVPDATPTPAPEPANEFYTKMNGTNSRPIAFMIDNDEASSRPQAGLEDAYMIYEIVVEGQATRMMALFKDVETSVIGPIRSARHYFLDYALENDAVYVHAGQSPQAEADIPNLGVNNINGITGTDGGIFWRDSTFTSKWHTLYTSYENAKNHAEKKGYRLTTDDKPTYKKEIEIPEGGTEATYLSFPYAGFYKVTYNYDETTGLYVRNINGAPHSMQSGAVLSPVNILVLYMSNYDLNDGQNKGRQNVSNIGSGSGFYVSQGKSVPITWSKDARKAKTVFTYENGEEVILNPGQTFVQIVSPSLGSVIE